MLDEIDADQLIKMPQDARAEGGDVILWNEYLFVGYSEAEDFEKYQVARTNKKVLPFCKHFSNRKVKAFELKKSDINARENALHLDCCFQPIGNKQAIFLRMDLRTQKMLISY